MQFNRQKLKHPRRSYVVQVLEPSLLPDQAWLDKTLICDTCMSPFKHRWGKIKAGQDVVISSLRNNYDGTKKQIRSSSLLYHFVLS